MTRIVVRQLMALLYLVAGIAHLVMPAQFLDVMPGRIHFPEAVVLWTGIAEIAGAMALAQWFSLPLRRLAGWCLAAYALCVWPANINHMLIDDGANLAYHIPRMFAQPLLIWAALWASSAIDWPLHRAADGRG